jgi:hypothetical protein
MAGSQPLVYYPTRVISKLHYTQDVMQQWKPAITYESVLIKMHLCSGRDNHSPSSLTLSAFIQHLSDLPLLNISVLLFYTYHMYPDTHQGIPFLIIPTGL